MIVALILWILVAAFCADTYLFARLSDRQNDQFTSPISRQRLGKFVLMASSVGLCFIAFYNVYKYFVTPEFLYLAALLTLLLFAFVVENSIRRNDATTLSSNSILLDMHKFWVEKRDARLES